MSTLTLALPIPPGKVEAWRRFCQELRETHRVAYEASRRQLGITHERFELVQTPFGTAIAATIEAEDVATALTQLATSTAPFDRWFKQNIRHYHGLDLAQTFPSDQRETIFEWTLSDIHD